MSQLHRILLSALLTLVAAAAAASDDARPLKSFDIPYEMFQLDNGLTVVVSEDRSLPEVHIEMRYFVGSRDEKPGKTGFAHLFEHLMFNGSENFDQDYFDGLRSYGAQINGSTNPDRTNYYNIVPTHAVERTLFLESDRMGHFLGALTQEKLDEQRGVVQNEKRQGDNRTFGYMRYKIVEGLFPTDHPYSWSTIGSMDDLDAASLDDAKEWFREYYGPSNAAIILVGDIDVATARELTQKYFGDIEPGPAVARIDDWVPERTHNSSEFIEDPKAKAIRILRLWATPGSDTRDGMVLQSVADALNDQSTEWLYKSLVEGEEVADSVSAGTNGMDLAGWFSVVMNLKAGVDPEQASAALDRVMARFLENGPTLESIEGGKTGYALRVARSFEVNAARASILANGATLERDPSFYKQQFAWYDESTPEDVRDAAREWLNDGSHEIVILPYRPKTASDTGVDRSVLPEASARLPIRLPEFQDTTLDNGVRVRFVESRAAPMLTFGFDFEGGNNRLSSREKAVHDLMIAVLGTQTKKRSRDELVRETNRLGASISGNAADFMTSVSLISLKANASESIDLLADSLRNAVFSDSEFDQQHTNAVKGFLEAMNSTNVASLYRDRILFGEDHPYASYDLEELQSVTREDTERFYEQWIRPDNLTIYAAGDSTLDEVRDMLNARFGKWRTSGKTLDDVQIAAVDNPPQGRVVLFDVPGAVQSSLGVYQIVPGMQEFDAEEYARRMALRELSGHFGSRINSNLREEKGWSYGMSGGLQSGQYLRNWSIGGSVQTDKTVASIQEILSEMEAYGTTRPITPEQLNILRDGDISSLATATTSTAGQSIGYMRILKRTGFDEDYVQGLPDIYDSVAPDDVIAAYRSEVDRSRLTWVIVGDLDEIEEGVRGLNLGQVEVWDANGRRAR